MKALLADFVVAVLLPLLQLLLLLLLLLRLRCLSAIFLVEIWIFDIGFLDALFRLFPTSYYSPRAVTY